MSHSFSLNEGFSGLACKLKLAPFRDWWPRRISRLRETVALARDRSARAGNLICFESNVHAHEHTTCCGLRSRDQQFIWSGPDLICGHVDDPHSIKMQLDHKILRGRDKPEVAAKRYICKKQCGLELRLLTRHYVVDCQHFSEWQLWSPNASATTLQKWLVCVDNSLSLQPRYAKGRKIGNNCLEFFVQTMHKLPSSFPT